MKLPIRAAALEARSIAGILRQELGEAFVGPVLVTGMLSEQLARELAAGAQPGAVTAGDASQLRSVSVIVHVMAGEPSTTDDEVVREADKHGVPVVLVQLWPQAEWTRPFVLTPFVVECRAGEGFPVPEIARRIVEATEHSGELARRAPVLQEAVARAVVGTTTVRAALLGALARGSRRSRPLLALEQVRMLAELRTLTKSAASSEVSPSLAGVAAATVGAGFLFREAARRARGALPAPIVDAAVAAAGTWALGEAFRRLEIRITS